MTKVYNPLQLLEILANSGENSFVIDGTRRKIYILKLNDSSKMTGLKIS